MQANPNDPNAQPAQPGNPPAQPAAGNPHGQPSNPNFQLVPESGANIIDYNTKEGISLYSAFTRSLYQDPADLFNLDAAGLQTFLALLQHCGNTSGWDFEVPQDLNNLMGDLLNLLSHHG